MEPVKLAAPELLDTVAAVHLASLPATSEKKRRKRGLRRSHLQRGSG
jgi:hypothetical protein